MQPCGNQLSEQLGKSPSRIRYLDNSLRGKNHTAQVILVEERHLLRDQDADGEEMKLWHNGVRVGKMKRRYEFSTPDQALNL